MAETGSEMETETDTREGADGEKAEGERDPPSLLGRLLFGGVLAYTAIDGFRNLDGQIAYAEANGVPVPERLVPLATGLLAFGSVGVALWRVPRLATAAVVTFLAAITPTMHDFWNAPDEQRGNERNHFVKNVAMLGAAVAFLRRATGR
ncbi:DoxX family protein [Halomarina pelagica]|uniref:DoxX family protein n=1 Tax=Halomarina pelagica TaxID=2961599 RepID=UPI0020C362E9|nr:DoxX family protein [Halomarina sp. BND7]